jgi:hypothetical protein
MAKITTDDGVNHYRQMISRNNHTRGKQIGGLGTFYFQIGREFSDSQISKRAKTSTKRVFKKAGLSTEQYETYRNKA